tara:strand:+ start:292 stop:1455 length:1164 start_codon:yes stop_codon:yes gene_type:complete
MAMQYHQVVPESSADSYSPFTTVDFSLMTPGRKLLKNSIRVEGKIVTRLNTTDPWLPPNAAAASSCVTFDSNVKLDNAIGAHCFFDSFSTETQSAGVIENLQNYPRFVSQHARATLAMDDMLSSKLVAEQRGPYEINGNYSLQPVVDQAFVTGSTEQTLQRSKPSFSIKPMTAFNRQAGGDYSFDRKGFIRLSMILANNNNALFGGAGGATYVLEDLVCRFVTIPDDGADEPMLMRSYVNVVSSMQSTATTISARVPSSQVNSVTMSFAEQSHLQSQEFSSTALESLPLWDSVEYLFANSMQNFITYRIVDMDDSLRRGLESLESAGHSQVSAKTLAANKGQIMGLAFEEFVDLSNQKFTINLVIRDPLITQEPRDVFLYFNSLLQM